MTFTLLDTLGTTDAFAGVFSDRSLLAAMLQFEVALARAEGLAGVIPADAVDAISRAADRDAFDVGAIAVGARTSGTIAIGFVEAFTGRVRTLDARSAGYVHWGATSQDLTDTALVLCLGQARPLLERSEERRVGKECW